MLGSEVNRRNGSDSLVVSSVLIPPLISKLGRSKFQDFLNTDSVFLIIQMPMYLAFQ